MEVEMPLIATKGAASVQGFGEFAQSAAVNYIEDVFSTYLWAGNSSSQSINIGFDLTTSTAMTWFKDRTNADGAGIVNTVQGNTKRVVSYATDAASNASSYFEFTSTGYNFPSSTINTTGSNYVGWTFVKKAKFFDVVTYTGNGTTQAISHNLGSTPGCVIVKRTDTTGAWQTWHRGLTSGNRIVLNTSAAETSSAIANVFGNNTNYVAPTSTNFTVGDEGAVNANSGTFVAYIFAHDAGGFGLTGSDNVISCGSFTTNGSGTATVTLGYEPQWLMIKVSSTSDDWNIGDSMRGMPNGGTAQTALKWLKANSSSAESTVSTNYWYPTATGFTVPDAGYNNTTFIYVAIRRGPMKTPTSATSVFIPSTWTGNGNTGRTISSLTSPVDLAIVSALNSQIPKLLFSDRLRGSGTGENSGNMKTLTSTSTVAESNSSLNGYYATLDYQDRVRLLGSSSGIYNNSGTGNLLYSFRRAPGFFDVVCWTRSSNTATLNHNLGVVPQLIIKKDRSRATYWDVMPNVSPYDYRYVIYLNDTQAISGPSGSIYWNAAPTATTFDVNMQIDGSSNGDNFVAYLFATVAGVSKVGSYTGTGTTQTIDCGFTAGSRFVMIKRTDSTGDWYVWDSARGIVAGNDPYLLINSTAAEVTNTDYVDTANSGFEISSTAPAAINANGGTFIFFAVA
jgi:hypothetical protein